MLSSENCSIFSKYFTNKVIDYISGNDENALFGEKPSDVVMIGMIKAEVAFLSLISNSVVISNQFESVPSIGLTFKLENDTKKINVTPSGKFYYRVTPTYSDQLKFLLAKYSRKFNKKFTNSDDLSSYIMNNSIPPDELDEKIMFLYKCLDLSKICNSFELNIDDFENSLKELNKKISELLTKAIDEISKNSVAFNKISNRKIFDFLDEDKFNNIVKSNVVNVKPNWSVEIIGTKKEIDKTEITLQIINKTKLLSIKDSYEFSIFNAGISVSSSKGFVPIHLNSIKHNYCEPENIFGIGVNCAVDMVESTLVTNNIPSFLQYRLKTNENYSSNITFDALIKKPVENLKTIKNGLDLHLSSLKSELEENRLNKSDYYIQKFSNEIRLFEQEIERFEEGILLIDRKEYVKSAFKLMNRTFEKNSKYNGWRLFQIVFIVSEICDIVYSEYKEDPNYKNANIDNVDLLYFPTGGGKTEAFFGCSIFTAFFDRLRGKSSNTSVVIKYPLRLLSSQQLDRLFVLTIKANEVKKEFNVGGDIFTVGLFSGSKNTPNFLSKDDIGEIENGDETTVNEKFRYVDFCPICGKPIVIKYNKNESKLTHTCIDCGELPLLIVDTDIYNEPPTFVVSTIDKLASIGLNKKFKYIFGAQKDLLKKIKDPAPTLFIQDELHLVNESLGTFDAHYESFLYYFINKLLPKEDRKKIKYIGATATISDFESHCLNLYQKNGRCFPTQVKNKNFYSYVDETDLNRIIIGAALYGASITDCLQKLITIFRIKILNMIRYPDCYISELKENGFTGDINELIEVCNQYLISIVYNTSKEEANKIASSMQQGNNKLIENGFKKFNLDFIIGDVDFLKIKNIISDVEETTDKVKGPNLIISTSSISHGVDVDCFNQIFFYGIPNKTSEYIQTYSRVGRKFTGIVFDIIRLARDRDRSYLKNFDSFHRYKDKLIEPVPINRWAKNAIYNTLPGIISALFLQYYCKGENAWAIDISRLIGESKIVLEDLINIVKEIYGCNNSVDGIGYSKVIEEEVTNVFRTFQTNQDRGTKISDLIADSNTKHKSPMTSLRDVDEQLLVEMEGQN